MGGMFLFCTIRRNNIINDIGRKTYFTILFIVFTKVLADKFNHSAIGMQGSSMLYDGFLKIFVFTVTMTRHIDMSAFRIRPEHHYGDATDNIKPLSFHTLFI